jgi:hypothetical protein
MATWVDEPNGFLTFLQKLIEFAEDNNKIIMQMISADLSPKKFRGLDLTSALMLLPVLFKSQAIFACTYVSRFCKNPKASQEFMTRGFRHSPEEAHLLKTIQEMGDQYVASLSSDDKVVIAKLLKAQRLSDEVEYSSDESSSEESD